MLYCETGVQYPASYAVVNRGEIQTRPMLGSSPEELKQSEAKLRAIISVIPFKREQARKLLRVTQGRVTGSYRAA